MLRGMLDPATCQRLIVYGGTFDPPHRAHVALPFAAAEAIDADGVLYVPSGQPPHKLDTQRTDPAHRLAMLRLALGDREDYAICTYELDHDGPSYTWRTLKYLREQLGETIDLRLLIGLDMALIFHDWRRPERIVELCDPLVLLRPPHDRAGFLESLPDDWRAFWRERIVEAPEMDVSSRAIREAIASGDHTLAERWLAPEVLAYIDAHDLYAR